ncbi:MAG: cyclase family protein [Terriglobales bacterium]|jgi:kynurenine formamidase
MRWRTFMIGWTMALAVLLIAHPKPPAGNEDVGTAVVELTYAASPNSSANRQWNANAGHAPRIVAPLVVLDVTGRMRADANYLLSMEDIARWEELHGHVPPNAVVMARSEVPVLWRSQPERRGHDDGNAGRFPGFSEDAIRFLVEARYAYGLGTETPANGPSVVLVYRPGK